MDKHRRREFDIAFHGASENEELMDTPDYFWTKGIIVYGGSIRLEGFEDKQVHIKHKDLKHLLINENLKTVLIEDCHYSFRDFTSKKYIKADLSYPIIIIDSYRDDYKWKVMDGHTRINKAKHRGHTSIEAYHIQYDDFEKCCFFWDPVSAKNISIYEQRQRMGK
tara:strand:- start:288 stop:782 length:495 start_codon:yes stop_codon:yes gene_type:complete